MEDRGYVVDLGIKGVKAFMKSLDAEKYVQLHNEGIYYLHLENKLLTKSIVCVLSIEATEFVPSLFCIHCFLKFKLGL